MTENRTPYLEGVMSQPENLAESFEAVTADLRRGAVEALADPGIQLVFLGMGASLHALPPAVEILRGAGRRAWPLSATDALELSRPEALADAVVAVSQSGRSAETAEAMELLGELPTVAVTNDPDSAVGRRASSAVSLGSRVDTPVSTLSYTATLQALALLAEHLVGDTGAETTGRWQALPGVAKAVLDSAARMAPSIAERWAECRALDVTATGSSLASAYESALLVREAVHLPSTAMDTRQYLHGPLEVVEPGVAVLLFGDGREVQLARGLAEFGAEVLLVTTRDVPQTDRLTVFRIPEVTPAARTILEILPVQLISLHMATARGLEISGFRYHQDDTKLGS